MFEITGVNIAGNIEHILIDSKENDEALSFAEKYFVNVLSVHSLTNPIFKKKDIVAV